MMIVVLTYRRIKRKQAIPSSDNYSTRSSQSLITAEFKDPNDDVNFIKLNNLSSPTTINTPASSEGIWKVNPLYMASNEITEEDDSCVDQFSYDQKSVPHENDQDMDEPVSLEDNDCQSENEYYDDKRGLIQ